MDGILAVDKPAGWTSHDVVAVCRGALGVRRVGHGGTLDPLATGVLPILVGRATKWADTLHTADKAYGAVVRFGAETTTDDGEGSVTREALVPDAVPAIIDAALEAFRGEIQQTPPDYAAVKVDGRRAYARARAGQAVMLAARPVRIRRLAIATWEPPHLRLLVVCSTGTYVRALARDLGRALGSAAHLAALIRVTVGAIELARTLPVERVRGATASELAASLLPTDASLLVLPARYDSEPPERVLTGWYSVFA